MPLDVVDVCDDDGVSGESLRKEAVKAASFFLCCFLYIGCLSYQSGPDAMTSIEPAPKKDRCENCLRPLHLCMCSQINAADNRITVLILQFPREQFKPLNSAKLAQMCLKNSRLRTGLSWQNLAKALGRPVVPAKWGVLYLGSEKSDVPVSVQDRRKNPLSSHIRLEGIIALDGSWKQAKTLWWRNPWLLKLNRVVLNPPQRSLRTQVKRQALSTIEAVAMALEGLGENPATADLLRKNYRELIIKPGKQPLKIAGELKNPVNAQGGF
jgi:DTW domain-containing protein YfiP